MIYFIEGQAFSRSYDSAHPPVSKLDRRQTQEDCERETCSGGGGRKGVGVDVEPIIRPQESPAFYKSSNTL
jgi:hypothetical protein